VGCDQALLCDIGGTTARFAVLTGETLGPIDHVAVSACPTAIDAIGGFLGNRGDRSRIGAAVLGVAGPVEGGRCLITNSHWVADSAELRAKLGFASVTLINDFEAIAWAVPHLGADDVKPLAGGRAQPGEPMVVIGPGTGLGMAGIMCRGRGLTVIATEGGHATLPGTTPGEDAVIAHLRQRFGHASAERAVSGPGLENLSAAIAAIDNVAVASRTAAEITRLALDRNCTTCRAAVDMFCAMLGTVAGNLALTFRARGGVYLAGGIAPRLADYLAQSEFRARFEAKGRFREYVEHIPTTIIMNPDAAFLGLKSLAEAAPAR
jgi:glucokinase